MFLKVVIYYVNILSHVIIYCWILAQKRSIITEHLLVMNSSSSPVEPKLHVSMIINHHPLELQPFSKVQRCKLYYILHCDHFRTTSLLNYRNIYSDFTVMVPSLCNQLLVPVSPLQECTWCLNTSERSQTVWWSSLGRDQMSSLRGTSTSTRYVLSIWMKIFE